MFNINKKELYDKTHAYIDDFLSKYFKTNNEKANVVILFHYTLMAFVILYIMFGDLSYIYYGLVVFMLYVFITNMLFNGCIFLKLERKYLNNRGWYGLYHILEIFGITINSKNIMTFYYLSILLLFSTMVYRLFIR
jgi:hypothetical protein